MKGLSSSHIRDVVAADGHDPRHPESSLTAQPQLPQAAGPSTPSSSPSNTDAPDFGGFSDHVQTIGR